MTCGSNVVIAARASPTPLMKHISIYTPFFEQRFFPSSIAAINESTHSFGGSASQTSILCVFIESL
jgi:hypothetical protein